MKNHLQNRSVRLLLLTVAADGLFFGLTDPAKVASLWLVAGYLLAVVNLYWFFRVLVAVAGVYMKPIQRQQRHLTGVLTVTAAILLGMQSMGQLSVKDMAVLLPLVVLGYFYLRYGQRRETGN